MDLHARLGALPIFPLPAVQLFPHALLPLHVFEPRYRQLLRDCLAADRLLAVATLCEDDEAPDQERPAVHTICGLGEVIAHEPLDDGRSNILLRGVTRVRIVNELDSEHPYRLVQGVALTDQYSRGVNLGTAQRLVVTLADQLASRLPDDGEALRSLARQHSEPGALADVLGAALIVDPEIRQFLLETVDVGLRLELITGTLARALAQLDKDQGLIN